MRLATEHLLKPGTSLALIGNRSCALAAFTYSEGHRRLGLKAKVAERTRFGFEHVLQRRGSSQVTNGIQQNGARAGVLKLFLYSKPDCHLCHGLKEKIDTAIEKARYMPSELSDAKIELLQVRDITTKPYWEKKYGLVIPILTVVKPGSEEEVKVRRVPPRSGSDKVADHILAAVRGGERIGED